MKWQPFGLWQRTVLAGDPSKPGCPSTVRVKFPAGTKVPEHVLEQDESFLVLSGNMQVGIGEKWNDAKLKTLRPGAFYTIPAGVSSFKTSKEEVIYQVSVIGPGGKGCPQTGAAPSVMLNPDKMQWQPYGISARRVVLLGDANKFNCPPYADRGILAAATRIPEHPDEADKTYTVISGTLYVGIGDKWDDEKLRKMPAGSFIAIPGGVNRYFKTEEEVVFQSSVTGFPRKGCDREKS
ncbi:MAG: cupin domain-containing protein [Burkholderiales bacterium]